MARKIGKNRWRVQIRVDGVRRGNIWSTKEAAEKEERELKDEKEHARAGMERPKDNILFLDYCATWFRKRERSNPKSTTTGEDHKLRRVLPALGNRPITFIRTSDILELLDKIQDEDELSNATRNRYRALLHKIFQDAFMEGKIIVNPVTRAPLLKETPPKKKALTEEELGKLMTAARAEGVDWEFYVILLGFTGGRISQIAALQNRDFDLERRTITFERIWEQATKGIENRIKGRPQGLTMPLFPLVADAFRKHLAATAFKRPDDFVFVNKRGQYRGGYTLKNRLKLLCEKAKIRTVTPHVLRATFATLAEEKGYSKEDLQAMLGHSTVTVTQKYTRRQVEPLIEKGERIGFGEVENENVVKIRKSGV